MDTEKKKKIDREVKTPKRCTMCDTDFPVKGDSWCAFCIKEAAKEFQAVR